MFSCQSEHLCFVPACYFLCLNGLPQIFQDGIHDHSGKSIWAVNRNYLVSPINGTLKYKRLGQNERGDPDTPVEKASLVLSDVSLTLTEVPHYSTLGFSVIVFTTYLVLSAILYTRHSIMMVSNCWKHFQGLEHVWMCLTYGLLYQ